MLHEIRTLTFLSIDDAKLLLELAIDSIEQAEGILVLRRMNPLCR